MARILAVDDSPSMRQLVKLTLSSGGHEVDVATDGVEALLVADKQQFDVVITDVNMPNMDGIALVRELRRRSNYRFTPLLMLTTESTSDRKQQGKEAGATGWLVKPFDPDRLLSIVTKVLT
ncbi:MAG TPA: response regulator [Steroidobacteraceae bacterium]|jgi:two-component system chemotaxis response regulator CheY|nr:response regulator [Steroidobacteraceae bacterium]